MQAALVASLRGSHVLYGSHYFPVRIIRPDPTRPGSPHAMMNTSVAAFPDECVIAINSEGLRFLTLERAPLDNGSFSYGELDGGWEADFADMLDRAGSSGWIDDDGAVRAHVEWRDA